MASIHAARLGGDDYQHLYSWWLALALLLPDNRVAKVTVEDQNADSIPGNKLAKVTVEDQNAGSVDDVTIRHEPGTQLPNRFYQVKYHTRGRNQYSATELITAEKGKKSLLEKFWLSWQKLRKDMPDQTLELYLISNWVWSMQDGLGEWIGGETDRINVDEFLAPSAERNIQEIRKSWQDKLQASDNDFRDFISCLHFRLGYSASVLVNEQVVERMRHLKLKTDVTSLKAVAGIVRDWIKLENNEITSDTLISTLKHYDLYLPVNEDRCITIYMESIEEQKYDRRADYRLSWRDYFVQDGPGGVGGHQLKDPANWNAILLPQLSQYKAEINYTTDCRFIKARGKSRLSCWFAFGYTFSEVASYTIEMDQYNQLWRTDAVARRAFPFTITSNQGSPEGEVLDGEGETVALGISISFQVDQAVRKHLKENNEKVAALLLLKKEDEKQKLLDAGEVVAMAESVKRYARAFVNHWGARKLLIFYAGPATGACFIGHILNAIPAKIQIMEDLQPGYAPSFLLK